MNVYHAWQSANLAPSLLQEPLASQAPLTHINEIDLKIVSMVRQASTLFHLLTTSKWFEKAVKRLHPIRLEALRFSSTILRIDAEIKLTGSAPTILDHDQRSSLQKHLIRNKKGLLTGLNRKIPKTLLKKYEVDIEASSQECAIRRLFHEMIQKVLDALALIPNQRKELITKGLKERLIIANPFYSVQNLLTNAKKRIVGVFGVHNVSKKCTDHSDTDILIKDYDKTEGKCRDEISFFGSSYLYSLEDQNMIDPIVSFRSFRFAFQSIPARWLLGKRERDRFLIRTVGDDNIHEVSFICDQSIMSEVKKFEDKVTQELQGGMTSEQFCKDPKKKEEIDALYQKQIEALAKLRI